MEIKTVEITLKRDGILRRYEYEKKYPWYDLEDWNEAEAEELAKEALYHFFLDHDFGFSSHVADWIFDNRKRYKWLSSEDLLEPLPKSCDDYVEDDYKETEVVEIVIYHPQSGYSLDPADDDSWEEYL